MTDKLHQINAQYSNEEDRILIRTSTEENNEYLIWLTRRFTKLLLTILDKEIEKRGGTTSLSTKKETKKLYTEGAFEKPYAEEKLKTRPLGEHGILAFGIKTGTDNSGNMILELQSETKQGITLTLNDTLLYMFYSLLTQSIERSEWQIGQFGERTPSNQLH
ncbi:MAG: hypothetical protein DHS20C09_18630 [marine bacterium B5-7]|nr:MAG: hypothetical protein DHS20C09_18630 [marine bacterium B5-7]